jgi:hypothetical protein
MIQKLQNYYMRCEQFRYIFITILVVLFYVTATVSAHAATISIDSGTKNVAVGDEYKVDFSLTSRDTELNALEGVVSVPKNLTLVRVMEGGSIVNFWVHNPSDTANQSTDSIAFSGVIPGGYAGENGKLFSIIFKVQSIGTTKISIDKMLAFINDGAGSKTPLSAISLELIVHKVGSGLVVDDGLGLDKTPPEVFLPEIGQDSHIYDGKKFVVFSATDKDSGIDRYEINEGSGFVSAVSPYILIHQNGDVKIVVRAIDRAGNIREEVAGQNLSTNSSIVGYLRSIIWIILVVCIVLVLIVTVIKRRRSVL